MKYIKLLCIMLIFTFAIITGFDRSFVFEDCGNTPNKVNNINYIASKHLSDDDDLPYEH